MLSKQFLAVIFLVHPFKEMHSARPVLPVALAVVARKRWSRVKNYLPLPIAL